MRVQNLHTIPTGIALALCLLISAPVDVFAQRRPNVAQAEQRAKNGNNNRQSSNGRRPNTTNSNSLPKNQRQESNRPKTNVKPGNHNHAPKNNYNIHQGHHKAPAHHHHHRPIPKVRPPQNWCPHHNTPIISGIFGITFGSLFNATINHLIHNNYVISHYTNDAIYLLNAVQCGHTWNDARINFAWGKMTSAQFTDFTIVYDTRRYNDVYLTLTRTYGAPISMRTLSDGGYECIWYGGDRHGMVSLEYYSHAGRFYTTLSFGY